jgi:transposase
MGFSVRMGAKPRSRSSTATCPPKLADAIRYALSRWEGLTRFIDDGRIELDNNTVERSIRPIALNRKNALFAGSDGGAEHWATIASLIETCKLNDVDPLGYLTDVLTSSQRSSQQPDR